MIRQNIYHIIALVCGVLTLIVYIFTLAPTVWFIDSGELAAVASTLGIAHPTGYPLFTIVGHLFTLIPFWDSQVYKLNLMSAFFSSMGVFVFFHLVYFILKRISSIAIPKGYPKYESIVPVLQLIISASSSLVLGLSLTFWNSANSVEVYPLHSFFIIALCYFFLKALFYDEEIKTKGKNKYYLIFAFILGLSFTNHLTTILLAPACLTLFLFVNFRDRRRLYRLIGLMILCFVAGLSVYLYLPLRMQASPDFMWGSPHNLERFIWHVTGKQFSVWIFSAKGSIPAFLILMLSVCGLSVYGLIKGKSLPGHFHFMFFIIISILGYIVISSSDPVVKTQLVKFTSSLWGQFGAGMVLLALPGIYNLSKNNQKIYYFTILAFFGCVFYSINYDIHDIYSYFLLAYITLAVWISSGLFYISCELINVLKIKVLGILYVMLILLPLIPLILNYEENDESRNYYVEEMTMNVFKNIQPGGIVLSSQWDFWVSASWYYNFVKDIRRDIIVIDKELLRRSWYFSYIEKHYPEIYNNSRKEIEAFLTELYKFEHGIPYSTPYIIQLFEDLLTSFVKNNQGRNFYISWEIEQNKNEPFARDYIRIPDGLLFRLVNKDSLANNTISDYRVYDFSFTPVMKKDYYHETLMKNYAMMLTASSNYLLTSGRIEDAKFYINLALRAIPDYAPALEIKRKHGL